MNSRWSENDRMVAGAENHPELQFTPLSIFTPLPALGFDNFPPLDQRDATYPHGRRIPRNSESILTNPIACIAGKNPDLSPSNYHRTTFIKAWPGAAPAEQMQNSSPTWLRRA